MSSDPPDPHACTADGPPADDAPTPDVGATVARERVRRALFGFDRVATIGRFSLLSRVGAGGMGEVYAAYDPELDRRVAVKVIAADAAADARGRERMRAEARALAKISHPNVVPIFDVGVTDEGPLFIAMEFVDGDTLRAWLAAAPRRWSSIVEVFAAAGRGLAAAHERGLVHRDFKPDNVMIGRDGRVRVVDFGLVRREVPPTLEASLDRTASQEASLTRTGALVGTLAYASPEQLRGAAVDARSDQFSFCVALYEALVGRRPFVGQSVAEIRASMRTPPDPPGGVPEPIARAIRRGLSPEPGQRFASMAELVDAIGHDPLRRRRRRIGAAVLVVVVAGLVGTTLVVDARRQRACRLAGEAIEEVWGPPQREAMQATFAGASSPLAAPTWDRVDQALGAYAERWAQAREGACGGQPPLPPTLEARRLRCLGQRREALEAAVAVLSTSDDRLVRDAVQVVTALPSIDRCDEPPALLALPPEPPAEQAPQVARLRSQLARARAQLYASRLAAALAAAQQVRQEAQALDHAPLLAQADALLGAIERRRGRLDEARAHLEDAYFLAGRLGLDRLAAEAVATLLHIVSDDPKLHDQAERWSRAGDMSLARADAFEGEIHAHLRVSQGFWHAAQQQHDEAVTAFEHSLAIRQRIFGPDHPRTADSWSALAGAYRGLGRYAEAQDAWERALALHREGLGPDHPDTAGMLLNLGLLAKDRGDYATAIERLEDARQRLRRVLGPRSDEEGKALRGLAATYLQKGDYAAAIEAGEQAAAVWEAVRGPQHPDVATALMGIANAWYSLDELSRAADYYARARTIFEAALGSEHAAIATVSNNEGNVAMDRGDYDAAVEHLERARRIWETTLGPEHPHVAVALGNLGQVRLEQGHPEQARPLLERAIAIKEQALGPEHPGLAPVLVTLGRLEHRDGHLDRARRALTRGLALRQGAVGPTHADLVPILTERAQVSLAQGDAPASVEDLERALLCLPDAGQAAQRARIQQALDEARAASTR